MTHKNYHRYNYYLQEAIKAVNYMYATIIDEETLHDHQTDEYKNLRILEGNIFEVIKTWKIFNLYYNNLHDTD